jgi:hypothetical protein
MIVIPEASETAVREALLRLWGRRVQQKQPPHEEVPDEVAALAGQLAGVLDRLDEARRSGADPFPHERDVSKLLGRLAAHRLYPPGP